MNEGGGGTGGAIEYRMTKLFRSTFRFSIYNVESWN